MSVAPLGPESSHGVGAERSAVLKDRRRPGRREVAPELVPLLRGQGPVLAEAAGVAAVAVPFRDDLATVSGIMRGLGIASLGWAAVGLLFLH